MRHLSVWILSVLLLCGCQSNVEKHAVLDKKLESIKSETYFSFDTLQTTPWDICYIVMPYGNPDDLPIQLEDADKEKIRQYANFDSLNQLLFVKDGTLTDIGIVHRNVMDFASLSSPQSFTPQSQLQIDADRRVVEII